MESKIITLTVNPSLDKSTTFEGLRAEQKIRCDAPNYDAGGGGINVSKAISRLGGETICLFTSGGATGAHLEQLVRNEKINPLIVPVQSETRENLIALDTTTKSQYRFGFPGGELSATEQLIILKRLSNMRSDFLVASGSLNQGMPADFYAKIAHTAKKQGAKFVLDTSGEALREALAKGVYLVKPNVGELAKLIGVERLETDQADEAAMTLIDKGQAQIVVVSLGPQGAVLVSKKETHFIPAPNVQKKSTVGAGDSMVGGIVWALSNNKSLKDAIKWGVACGSAATMNQGTQLFKPEDATRLFKWLEKK